MIYQLTVAIVHRQWRLLLEKRGCPWIRGVVHGQEGVIHGQRGVVNEQGGLSMDWTRGLSMDKVDIVHGQIGRAHV